MLSHLVLGHPVPVCCRLQRHRYLQLFPFAIQSTADENSNAMQVQFGGAISSTPSGSIETDGGAEGG